MDPQPRYELKYWCSEAQARSVFTDLAPLTERDPNASDEAPRYTVTSLYFDTARLDGFLDKIEGERRRGKVRLRRYERSADGFLELKEKLGRRIRKWRLPLTAEAMRQVAHGDLTPLDEAEDGPARRRLLTSFRARDLLPAAITQYEREAWRFRDDPSVRVTLDTSLRCAPGEASAFLAAEPSERPLLLPEREEAAVLEVKVTGPVPGPVSRALRRAGLQPRAISKYCLAMQRTRRLPEPLARFPLGAPPETQA